MSWLHAVIDVPTAQLAVATGQVLGVRLRLAAQRSVVRTTPSSGASSPEHGRPYLHVQEVEGSPRVHLDVGG